MKIVKLNSKPDKDGYFPIPKNMLNWRMFCYPYPVPRNRYDRNVNKKVNALVCYYGELFGDKEWSIGMMGFDCMLIWDDKNLEVDCYYKDYCYEGGQTLYVLEDEGDWTEYMKIRTILLRKEKIDKIINK